MNHRLLKTLPAVVVTGLLLGLVACTVQETIPDPQPVPSKPLYVPPAEHLGLQDFGDPNTEFLAQRLRAVQSGSPPGQVLNIIQMGDSHTASDTFTSGVRNALRQHLGDAGIGWLTPMNVRGQSHSLVKMKSRHWTLLSSRSSEHPNFPLGGYIASPTKPDARIEVELRKPDTDVYQATVLIRPNSSKPPLKLVDATGKSQTLMPSVGKDGWGHVRVNVRLPFSIMASAKDAAQLGGLWLTKSDTAGVQVSPIGANGVRQVVWKKWSAAWLEQLSQTQADLVILAYGTNEAFNDTLDADAMARELAKGIRQVRQALPKAAVLLIAAPDALISTSDSALPCAQRRPSMHATVKKVQYEVAQQEKVLYWDWQTAMGGACPMLEWFDQGLVGKDLVHFTGAGYQESAKRFYADFTGFFEQRQKVKP